MWTIAAIAFTGYVVMAAAVFWLNVSSGPVTLGLAAVRGILWPLWIAGYLQGERSPMD